MITLQLLRPLRIPLASLGRKVAPVSPSRPISLSASRPLLKNVNLPPRPKPPPEEEIEESFLKGSGPGGQKINKTSSAVQLKHLPTGIVVKSQATRSRSQNRTIARRLLADKLDQLARGDESRSAVVGEFKRKKKASAAKKSRRKYRKLEENQANTAAAEEASLEEEAEADSERGLADLRENIGSKTEQP
ncbi:RF-1 domain-containing protein [Hypoxylon sp. NC1633]|nr:RF-1 domain-containing protein [Hypoxylon sp. NC1633]